MWYLSIMPRLKSQPPTPPNWFKTNNYSLKTLKRLSLLEWWDQFFARAFIRTTPVDHVECAQYFFNEAFNGIINLINQDSVDSDNVSDEVQSQVINLASIMIHAVTFLRQCRVESFTLYQQQMSLIVEESVSFSEMIAESVRELKECRYEHVELSEPKEVESDSLLPIQEELITMIEADGIVEIDSLFKFGDWVYNFPPDFHMMLLQRKRAEVIKIRQISLSEAENIVQTIYTAGSDEKLFHSNQRRAFLSIPMNLPDALLKREFALWLEDAREKIPVAALKRRESTWAESGILPCLDLMHWNLRNGNKLSLQNIIDFSGVGSIEVESRAVFNKTTKPWMVKALTTEFLQAFLSEALAEED